MAKPSVRVKAGSSPYTGPALAPLASAPLASVPARADTAAVSAPLQSVPLAAPVAVPHRGASTQRVMRAYRPSGYGPNSAVSFSQPELVRRSRDLRRNNPHAKRALDLYATHIVGTGIRPRFLCKNKATREKLAALWDAWTRVADPEGVLDFYGLQAQAVREMAEAGEVFGRLRPRRVEDNLPVPLQVQLIPAEQVPLYDVRDYGGNRIVQGIELAPFGLRAAYWVTPFHPGDPMPAGVNNDPVRVPGGDVVHLYAADRVGQMRGLPWLAAAITTLHQVNDYVDAELLRKQMVAALVGFVKKADNADITAEQVAASYGDASTGAYGELAVALEPGTMQYLNPGEDVEFTNPADVGGSFEAFISANYRAVSAATNLIYEELTGDWKGANDRTFRAISNTFRRAVAQWQWGIVVHQLCEPTKNRWLDFALASGALALPRGVALDDARRCDWRPQRHDYINPAQDIEATGRAIALGLTSRSAEIAERGDDAEMIDGQIAADREREARLGLSFGETQAPPADADPASGAATPRTTPAG